MIPIAVSTRYLIPLFIIFAIPFALIIIDRPVRSAADADSEFNFDIRAKLRDHDRQALDSTFEVALYSQTSVETDLKEIARAANDFRSETTGAAIEFNTLLGNVEVIGKDEFASQVTLTAPSTLSRVEILKRFLRQNAGLFAIDPSNINNLRVTADYSNPAGNLSYVHLEQFINGISVFGGEVKAGFTPKNEIVRVINGLAPNLPEVVPGDFGDPSEAMRIAQAGVPGNYASEPAMIYFPIASGVVRPAWRVLTDAKGRSAYTVIDAESGTILWRKSLTEDQTQPSTYEVYGNATSFLKTADSPSPFTPGCLMPVGCPQPPAVARQQFTLIGNEPPYEFNNLGWIPDGENRSIGNNAEAGIDRDAMQGIDPNGWAFGTPNRNFVYAYNPPPGIPAPGDDPFPVPQIYPPSPYQQGSITHVFYTANRWHDELYRLGFTEQARNFQTDNFGRGGLGSDSLSIEIQEGIGTNGANFSTPADGGRPRAQFFIWTGPTPDRDGALDSQVVVHELTHGLSNRLHGNAAGLTTNMSRGMGEGWSDFYALAMLSEPADDPCGTYAVGGYITYQLIAGFEGNYYYGIRRFPVARRSCLGPNGRPHNPLTFRYINSDCNTLIGTTTSDPPPSSAYPRGPIGVTTCDQVHNIGEVWSTALWEVRGFLIEAHGAAEGNRRALQYITDGMKLAPIAPTILQERDAIIAAAAASDPSDVLPVRRGFATRGMGAGASIQNIGTGGNNAVVTESFEVFLRGKRSDFDGDGRADLAVFRPSDGIWYQERTTGGFVAIKWGLAGDRITPGDFDGDQKTDSAIFRPDADPSLPDFYILNSASATYSGISWGLPGDIPVIADYDGDNRSDIAVFRPSNHTFYVRKSTDAGLLTFSNIAFGTPVAGDFEGDGRADFATYSIDGWFLAPSNINYASVNFVRFGAQGDKPVPADYDGDGRDDFAVYRPSDQIWYVRRTTGGTTFFKFGLANDVPVPADYDGDGLTDFAVYRDGTWYIQRTNAGIWIRQFGLAGDLPVPAGYLP
jgi:hypothetical protein